MIGYITNSECIKITSVLDNFWALQPNEKLNRTYSNASQYQNQIWNKSVKKKSAAENVISFTFSSTIEMGIL